MVFSSSVFLFLFLPIVLAAYWLTPKAGRNALLLLASLFFYAWGEGFFVAVMLVSLICNYLGGLLIDGLAQPRARKLALTLTIGANLALLGSFKYANFIADNLDHALVALGLAPIALDPVHLPIGISFFTFQAMSYVIDVYRGDAQVQRNPINSALYIALFPQLIAGPIVRYHDIARQLVDRTVKRELFASGVTLFVVGLGKKMLIANPLGAVADSVFALSGPELSPAIAWLGIVCYSFQIYFDFSGYSDMAIGLGRMLGFRFLINFDYPYIARSMREFWRRWHISLSRWFRDYLYLPLGGSRGGPWRTYRNLLLVFLLCGLWHGASWNFVIWGLIHGTFLVLERSPLGSALARAWSPLRHAYVLLVVLLAWVFFRADDLGHALSYLDIMFGGGERTWMQHHLALYFDAEVGFTLAVAAIGSTPLWPWLRTRVSERGPAADYALVAALALIVVGAAMHLAVGTHNPFIYFRF